MITLSTGTLPFLGVVEANAVKCCADVVVAHEYNKVNVREHVISEQITQCGVVGACTQRLEVHGDFCLMEYA